MNVMVTRPHCRKNIARLLPVCRLLPDGSALAADARAASSLLATHVSASAATRTWMAIEWARHGKPSVLGAATGAIAGLAAVTPASGFVGPGGGMAIGIASGAVCFLAAVPIKKRSGYDDALDVFGVHGVGDLLGTIMVGALAAPAFGGNQTGLDIGHQLGVQSLAALTTIVYTAVVSWAILKVVDATVGLRVSEDEERHGLAPIS